MVRGEEKRLSPAQKRRLGTVMKDELGLIRYRRAAEVRRRLESLPDELRRCLIGDPESFRDGITLLECYRIYRKVCGYIAREGVGDPDPYNLWSTRRYWSDIVFREYRVSKTGTSQHGLYLTKVLFERREVERFRSVRRREEAAENRRQEVEMAREAEERRKEEATRLEQEVSAKKRKVKERRSSLAAVPFVFI